MTSDAVAITVVVPTYNPREDHIQRVLQALRQQTLPPTAWDLLIIDNNSAPPLRGRMDIDWHPSGRIVEEPTPGKMNALVAAFKLTTTPLILILDDDTVPAPDLIEEVLHVADRFPVLGTWSPRVELELEEPTLAPPPRLRHLLAERLIDQESWSNDPLHTPSTAWGGGMALRRAVADAYVSQTVNNPRHLGLDPVGDQPGYGGDTDLAYTGLAIGLGTGVFPQLRITHLIAKRRSTVTYLLRNIEAHEFSHQMQGVARTGSLPPPPGFGTMVRRCWRWLRGDALDRAILAAERRGRAAARRAFTSGVDDRAITHR